MRDGWIEEKLGDVARVTSGFAFSTKSWRDKGIPVIKINNVRNGQVSIENCSYISEPVPEGASRFLLKQGDLLITLTGEIGAIGFVTQSQPMYLNQRVGRLDLLARDKVSLKFIGLFLSLPEVRAEMWSQGKGNAQLNISPTSIQSLTIKLPPPPEQKRIVDLISSVDSYIKALQQQLESAKRSRNAVLHELLNAGGEDWVETTLGEICTEGLFADGDWVESKDQDPEGEYRLLQLADIGDGTFLNKSDRWMNREQFNRLGCTKLEVNDVLIARMPDPIGRACLFPEGLPVCATVVDVAIVRTGNETLQKFLALLINSSDFRTEAFSLLTGTTRQRISRGNLAKISFAIPSSEKQLEMVNLISLFDVEIAQSVRVIEEAKQLRSGLLNELLSGEHEIPATYDKVMGAA